jgi:hypothetical protein
MRCARLAAARIDEAHAYLATLTREQPQLSLDWVRVNTPWQTSELMDRYLDGMRKAGLTWCGESEVRFTFRHSRESGNPDDILPGPPLPRG